jgi:hypothetical protein
MPEVGIGSQTQSSEEGLRVACRIENLLRAL